MPKLFNFTLLALLVLTISFERIFAVRTRKMGGGKPPPRSLAKNSVGGGKINYIFDVNPKNVPDKNILYNIYISCEHNYRRYCQKDVCRLNNLINLNAEERKCPNEKFVINFEQEGNIDNFHLFKFECPSISSGNPHHYNVECDLSAETNIEAPGTCTCTLPESEEQHSAGRATMAGASSSSSSGHPAHGDAGGTSGSRKGRRKSLRRETTELAGRIGNLRISEQLDTAGSSNRALDAEGRRRDADGGRRNGDRKDEIRERRESGGRRKDEDGLRRKSGQGRRDDGGEKRKSGGGDRREDEIRERPKSGGSRRHKDDKQEGRYGQKSGGREGCKSGVRNERKSGGRNQRKSGGRDARKSGGRDERKSRSRNGRRSGSRGHRRSGARKIDSRRLRRF